MDSSIHDWLEGRGEPMVLILMIDDATSRALMRFYPGDTTAANMDLLARWIAATDGLRRSTSITRATSASSDGTASAKGRSPKRRSSGRWASCRSE